MSVELSLDSDDYANIRNACEAFFILRGTNLTGDEAEKLNGLVCFSDDERQYFGRLIANRFSYDDAEQGWEIVKRHHAVIHEQTNNKKLKIDADRALQSYETFMRDLWDELRIHKLGTIIAERFERNTTSMVRAAIG